MLKLILKIYLVIAAVLGCNLSMALSPAKPINFLGAALREAAFAGQVIVNQGVVDKHRVKYEAKVESTFKGKTSSSSVKFYGRNLKVGQRYFIFLAEQRPRDYGYESELLASDISRGQEEIYEIVAIDSVSATFELVPEKVFSKNKPVYGSPTWVALMPCSSDLMRFPPELDMKQLVSEGDYRFCWARYNDVLDYLRSSPRYFY